MDHGQHKRLVALIAQASNVPNNVNSLKTSCCIIDMPRIPTMCKIFRQSYLSDNAFFGIKPSVQSNFMRGLAYLKATGHAGTTGRLAACHASNRALMRGMCTRAGVAARPTSVLRRDNLWIAGVHCQVQDNAVDRQCFLGVRMAALKPVSCRLC